MNIRKKLYYKLNIEISTLDNNELTTLLAKTEATDGWGTNHIIDAFNTKFVSSQKFRVAES